MRSSVLFSAIAIAGISLSTAASAVTMQAVYTGKVSSGLDRTNVFGAGENIDLTDFDFTATFIYDPSIVGASNIQVDNAEGSQNQVYGGTSSGGFGYVSPILSAKIEIAGGSYSLLNPGYYGMVESTSHKVDPITSTALHQVEYLSNTEETVGGVVTQHRVNDKLFAIITKYILEVPFDLETAYTLMLAGDGSSGTDFITADYVNECVGFNCTTTFNRYASAFLNPTKLEVTRVGDTPTVPLPAALPLFATAVAGMGLLGWRRRVAARA